MKALIIGAAGFAGKYLADHLQQNCGWSVSVTKLEQEHFSLGNTEKDKQIEVYDLNILEAEAVIQLLEKVEPDYVFHLAAQSSVAVSWQKPQLTMDINIKGCLNLLEAMRRLEKKPRTLLIGSGEEYGRVRESEIPLSEDTVLRPGNIYAVTKACQNMLGRIYADAYQLPLMMVRAFNHIGPGQSPVFVVADFCKQVAEIEAGEREPVIYVGNLSARRDFTDVRDIVRAYALLAEHGRVGEIYNVGSGHAVSIQSILDQIIGLSGTEIEIQVDSAKLRPVDIPVIEADITKLQKDTGWKQEISLQETLGQVLETWRK